MSDHLAYHTQAAIYLSLYQHIHSCHSGLPRACQDHSPHSQTLSTTPPQQVRTLACSLTTHHFCSCSCRLALYDSSLFIFKPLPLSQGFSGALARAKQWPNVIDPSSQARMRPGVNLGSDALGRMDAAVPARDTMGVPTGVGRVMEVTGLDPGLDPWGVDA
jgi:hypothetical protein